MLFLNIGWMARYQGLDGQPDNIVNGGKWVTKNGHGHEVCNFLPASDGYIYGHVESSRGEIDRQINFDNLGIGTGKVIPQIDIVWTATSPAGGRYVVGWYKNATLFRKRKTHKKSPSKQHARDELTDYRTKVIAENAFLLQLEQRTLKMPKKKGWMGHTQWWARPHKMLDGEMEAFFLALDQMMGGQAAASANEDVTAAGRTTNGGAAQSPYTRYVEAYEIRVTPQHHQLQNAFAEYLRGDSAAEIKENIQNVDLMFRDKKRGLVLSEIKPCQTENARFAIRMAMGQLLDYRQRNACDNLLIALGACPSGEDLDLALGNGFGVAYPKKSSSDFEIRWPSS